MSRSRIFVGCLTMSVYAACSATPVDDSIARIVSEGKNRNQVMKHLAYLTRSIGPRLTGSPNLEVAQKWAVEQFKQFGCTNVHLEQWGEVPVGFQRGPRQVARMVTPFTWDLEFTTMNWTEGTRGPVRAAAVMGPSSREELLANKEKYKDAWVLMPRAATMRGPSDLTPPRENAPESAKLAYELSKGVLEAGAKGRIYPTANDLVHSSGSWREKTFDSHPMDLTIVMRRADFDRVARTISLNQKPELVFDIENNWFKGPIPQYNVIADIKGTEKPDEMVIVSGHLDSWNTPGSQGACDNGTGTVVAMEAARILLAAKVKPKRTIRFILWSGEEQGLFGARRYVEMHKSELPKIQAMLNDDGGTGYQAGYEGLESMKSLMEAAMAPTQAAFPDLPMSFRVRERMPSGGSSDHAAFVWAGVPAFYTAEGGPKANYGRVWHTQYDRYPEAVPEYLIQSSTNHALVAFSLANSAERLPHFTPPPAQAVTLQEAVGADHVYQDPSQMARQKQLGLHDHEDDYVLHVADYVSRALRWFWATPR